MPFSKIQGRFKPTWSTSVSNPASLPDFKRVEIWKESTRNAYQIEQQFVFFFLCFFFKKKEIIFSRLVYKGTVSKYILDFFSIDI